MWAGPPTLDLARRPTLLAQLRGDIGNCGLLLAEIRGGWTYKALARDTNARLALEDDERTADEGGHWWLRDVVWRSSDDRSVLVYRADPDGNDVTFAGWGPLAPACLDAVRARLAAHQP